MWVCVWVVCVGVCGGVGGVGVGGVCVWVGGVWECGWCVGGVCVWVCVCGCVCDVHVLVW